MAEAFFFGVSAKHSDAFLVCTRGPGRAGCTEMHYSPGHLARTGLVGSGLPVLLLLFTLAPRPLLRSSAPGLSFRGIAQWSRTRARP